MLAEAVTGGRYETFVEDEILAQLGMHTARYFEDGRILPRLAGGYARDERGTFSRASCVSASLLYAAGGLTASVDDLIAWDWALRERGVLPAESHELMWTPVRLNNGREAGYGYGWGIIRYRGRRVVHHAGDIPATLRSMAAF